MQTVKIYPSIQNVERRLRQMRGSTRLNIEEICKISHELDMGFYIRETSSVCPPYAIEAYFIKRVAEIKVIIVFDYDFFSPIMLYSPLEVAPILLDLWRRADLIKQNIK